MRANFKVWIEDQKGNLLLGQGLETLLVAIRETGSLNQAAARLNMSYRNAWEKINSAETRLGYTLTTTRAGGVKGGGSRLTPKGEELLESFTLFHAAVEENIPDLFTQYFQK
jgi:molybdate transport system regulatory protein